MTYRFKHTKRFNLFATSLALLTSLFIVSCGSDNDEPATPPVANPSEIVVTPTEYSIASEGGALSINYTIINATEGTTLQVQSEAGWVVVESVTETSIELSIAANELYEARNTSLRLTYEGAKESLYITLTQHGKALDNFAIEISNLRYNGFTMSVTPKDEEMLYVINTISTEYFRMSGIKDGATFIAKEMDNLQEIAKNNKMTLEEILWHNKLAGLGATARTYSGMAPLSQYVAYCYGVEIGDDDNYTVTTPIHHEVVDIPMPTLQKANFVTKLEPMTESVRMEITPSDWNSYYYIQIAPENSLVYIEQGDELTTNHFKRMSDSFHALASGAMRKGTTAESFLRTYCYTGSQNLTVDNLDSGTRYMAIIFGVRSDDGAIPAICTEPTLAYFTTPN